MPVVLQEAGSGEVLSVGYMNRFALQATLDTGWVTLLSRRSGRLFVTRTATGDPAVAHEVLVDARGEALLVRVRIEGGSLECEEGVLTGFASHVTDQCSAPNGLRHE